MPNQSFRSSEKKKKIVPSLSLVMKRGEALTPRIESYHAYFFDLDKELGMNPLTTPKFIYLFIKFHFFFGMTWQVEGAIDDNEIN